MVQVLEYFYTLKKCFRFCSMFKLQAIHGEFTQSSLISYIRMYCIYIWTLSSYFSSACILAIFNLHMYEYSTTYVCKFCISPLYLFLVTLYQQLIKGVYYKNWDRSIILSFIHYGGLDWVLFLLFIQAPYFIDIKPQKKGEDMFNKKKKIGMSRKNCI